jgi:hypothetical protein
MGSERGILSAAASEKLVSVRADLEMTFPGASQSSHEIMHRQLKKNEAPRDPYLGGRISRALKGAASAAVGPSCAPVQICTIVGILSQPHFQALREY